MITICKGCGAALDESREACLQCGLRNPWSTQRSLSREDQYGALKDLLLEPFSSLRWRKQPARCPACDTEAGETAVRCSRCGSSLQAIRLEDRSGHSLEGIGVWIFLVVLVVYSAWARIEPWVYRIAPEFRASKHGPPEMPILIDIRQTGLRIANDSTGPRSCDVEIGSSRIFHATRFTLQASETRDVPYTSFTDDSAGLDEAAGYRRARQRIGIECIDRRGVARRIYF